MNRYCITYFIEKVADELTYFTDAKDEKDAKKRFKKINRKSEYRARIKIITIKQI